MRTRRIVLLLLAPAVVSGIVLAQPGRGGSQWLTALADAQRTSWIRSDDKISVEALSQPGFALQWQVKLDNEPRGTYGLGQGVTASGVTLFVPMSLVTGSSNTVYGIDNDLGYVVWQRKFDAPLPAPTPECPGGTISAATRIVSLTPPATAGRGVSFGRGSVGYRSLLGEPGEGVPVEGRRGAGASTGDPGAAAAKEAAAKEATAKEAAAREAAAKAKASGSVRDAAQDVKPKPPAPAGRAVQPQERIPGAPAPKIDSKYAQYSFLFRPSGVVYVISSDGKLHVLGLPSGKDMQRPAQFVPANARWSPPVAVNTTMYTTTTGRCGGAPAGVWAIDLDSEEKPVVSWKTNGGDVVGAAAFTTGGTLIAAIGPGQATGDGRANAIVALDPKTLQVKDWFTQPTAEFVTGPTIFQHGEREIVAAATKDGRVILLDASSLGGADHSTPLHVSKPLLEAGATVGGEALAFWRQSSAPDGAAPKPGAQPAQKPGSSSGPAWILLPVARRPSADLPLTNGAIAAGAVVALRVNDSGKTLSLQPGWTSHDLSSPATPIVINGVVFALATGRPGGPSAAGTPAVLQAYDGATGKRLWQSGKAMTTFASPGSMWSGLGQVYVGTRDGTLYAFGLNDERSPTHETGQPVR